MVSYGNFYLEQECPGLACALLSEKRNVNERMLGIIKAECFLFSDVCVSNTSSIAHHHPG